MAGAVAFKKADGDADENIFHFAAVPGGLAMSAATAHKIRMVIVTGITNLRKYVSLI